MSDVRLAASVQPAGEPANTALVREVKVLLASGDSAAAQRLFGVLVERYQRRAARIAYHYLRDPGEVEEAVQDAFLKVFTHLPACRADLRFDLWFSRIVVNGCLETRRRLLEAVERLPDRQRSAVLLTRFEGHSPREAGAILGLSEATVRVHLFRAVQTLRARLRGGRLRSAGRRRAESA
jgi:RNA polymerase sigma-70 factor (ECF subfamily)